MPLSTSLRLQYISADTPHTEKAHITDLVDRNKMLLATHWAVPTRMSITSVETEFVDALLLSDIDGILLSFDFFFFYSLFIAPEHTLIF